MIQSHSKLFRIHAETPITGDRRNNRRLKVHTSHLTVPGRRRNNHLSFRDQILEKFHHSKGQKHTRRIVATGVTTSVTWLDKHWDNPKKKTNYVRIKVTEMLELDDAIPVNLLEDKVPGVPWRVIRASGLTVRGKSQTSL